MRKKQVITGWVTDPQLYDEWGMCHISERKVIYRKKRFDTPYKIKVTIEVLKKENK